PRRSGSWSKETRRCWSPWRRTARRSTAVAWPCALPVLRARRALASLAEAHDEQQRSAHRDQHVGDVEGGPTPAPRVVDADEVHHARAAAGHLVEQAVDAIAQ